MRTVQTWCHNKVNIHVSARLLKRQQEYLSAYAEFRHDYPGRLMGLWSILRQKCWVLNCVSIPNCLYFYVLVQTTWTTMNKLHKTTCIRFYTFTLFWESVWTPRSTQQRSRNNENYENYWAVAGQNFDSMIGASSPTSTRLTRRTSSSVFFASSCHQGIILLNLIDTFLDRRNQKNIF